MKNEDDKFRRYRYMGAVYPACSEHWYKHIYPLLEELHRQLYYPIPKFVLNFIKDIYYLLRFSRIKFLRNIAYHISLPIVVSQIKEKFAQLRFYYERGDVEKMLEIAEDKCDITCEQCGSESGSLATINRNWLVVICDDCIKKSEKEYTRPKPKTNEKT